MVKKLDILLLKNFIGPFIVTFLVSLFVLVMQFLFVYMDDMIGKGLDTWILIKLLVLMSMPIVPLALPLAILLSSIMTFGSLGENFELVAIKANGISLVRFMRPLFIFIVLVSISAFLFMNYVLPVTNLQSYSLLYDVRNAKPALNIQAGQFYNEIDGYAIRVGSKDPDGRTIHDVLIYDNASTDNSAQVVVAKTGIMMPSADKKYLVFRLQNGWRYEDAAGSNSEGKNEQTRMYFKSWDKVFDLSGFKMSRTDADAFKGGQQFMTLRQLQNQLDSFDKQKIRAEQNTASYISPYYTLTSKDSAAFIKALKSTNKIPLPNYTKSVAELLPDSLRASIIELTTTNIRNAKNLIDISATDDFLQRDAKQRYLVEWHRKFTLSIACIVLFLIGAPLGALIRKGGIGLPLIFAIIFFVIYHLLSRTGEQYIKGGKLSVVFGMWMATMVLLPIAAILVYNAQNDAAIFNREWYNRQGQRIKHWFQKTPSSA